MNKGRPNRTKKERKAKLTATNLKGIVRQIAVRKKTSHAGQAKILELECRVRDSMMGRVATGDWVHGFVFVWAREAYRAISVSSECRYRCNSCFLIVRITA